ncbi:MAG TPA: matrixin family metalloprotease [Candidatus Polarisedimenticolia bacterium]|nr:matrixin family metalloprotease [Candidatus Polarisedimenticolia bacterium]
MKTASKVLAGAVLGLMGASSLSAYVLLSPRRHWASWPVTMYVARGHVSVADTDNGITAVVRALNNTGTIGGSGWNVCSGVGSVISAVKSTSAPWSLGDGRPTISLRSVIGGCGGSCLAATYTGYYSCPSGFHGGDGHCRINDSDVEGRTNTTTSGGGPYYSTLEGGCTSGAEFSVESIWVHEAGHQLGLGHSSVSGATMYPSVSSCSHALATLASDDCNGLNVLY